MTHRLALALAILATASTLTACAADEPAPSGDLEGVTVTKYAGGRHVTGNVEYAETPPMGGQHDPQWLACGTYDQPVREENAVHALEHGVLWVTYDTAQVDPAAFDGKLPENTILAPYDGLPSPVVISAWNRQLALTGPDDERLEAFVEEYGDGHTTVEGEIGCNGDLVRYESEDQ